MVAPTPARLMTLPVELIFSIMDQIDHWCDIQNLMRAYQGLENSNTITTRRFQKLMFRADARKLNARVNSGYGEYPLLHSVPAIPAGCWAILLGDVELALSAIEEYRFYGSEGHLYATRERTDSHLHTKGWSKYISVNLSPFNNPQKNMAKVWDPTPLMLAVLSGNIDMLKAIVDRCLDFERDEHIGGDSCLNEWREALDSLNPSVHYKVTALDLAAWQGRKDMVKVLTNKGAEVGWSHPEKDSHAKETCLMAALCDWGRNLQISEDQLTGRMGVLDFLLDQGYDINHANRDCYEGAHQPGHLANVPTNTVLPNPFTPLWYTIWEMKPEYLGLAQLLIRRGARWAPWLLETSMEWWPRQGAYLPRCAGTYRISPLEGVLFSTTYNPTSAEVGEKAWTDGEKPDDTNVTADSVIGEELDNKGKKITDNLRQPNEQALQLEETLFNMMMKEGAGQPTKPRQLKWAVETVLQAYSARPLHRHPRVVVHFVKMLDYLKGRGATRGRLHRKSVKILEGLRHTCQELADSKEGRMAIAEVAMSSWMW